jgi:LPS-assembly protein
VAGALLAVPQGAARAQDPGAIVVQNDAVGRGAGLGIIGGLDSAPAQYPSTGPTGSTYLPVTQGYANPGLPMVQSLGNNAGTAQAGAITLRPIDTNTLNQVNTPYPSADTMAAPGLFQDGTDPAPPPPEPDALVDDAKGRTLVSADEMTQDDDLGIVTARGNVTVISDDQTLRADVVTYNTIQNMVTASGDVSLTTFGTVSDDTTFAQYMELSGDLKNGFIRGVQMLMSNGARMAALYGERDDTTQRKEFSRGAYTACASCSGEDYPLPTVTGRRDGPRQPPPVWQLKAGRITHDELAHDIVYRDAWLEVFGVPVLYTPYLSQPDPTVYRRSGLLNVSSGSSDDLGATVVVPYYIVWDDHAASTVTAQYSELQNIIMHGTYDRNFRQGEFSFRGSMAPHDEEGRFQYEQESSGAWHFDETWRAGFESAYTSDPIYLDRTDIEPQDDANFLTSAIYLRGSHRRSALSAESIFYQDVTSPIHQDGTPYVPLLMDYNLVTDPLWMNGHAEVDLNGTVLRRGEGTNTNRIIGRVGYEQPFQDGLGSEWTFGASLRGDFYDSEDVVRDNGTHYTGSQGRFIPQGSLLWRYPLVRASQQSRHVIEPKVGFFAAPSDLNPDEIPNEDSQTFNLDISNLFQPSRLPGSDRVEGGQWSSYSLRYAYFDNDDQNLEVEVGQTYRLRRDTSLFPRGTGMDENLSDVVGRLRYNYGNLLSASYGTQIDIDTGGAKRHELTASVGTTLARLSGSYLYAERTTSTNGRSVRERNQLSGKLRVRLGRYWSAYGSHTYDVILDEPVTTTASLTYEDECVSIGSIFRRDHTEDFGEEEGTSFMLSVSLKTIGSYSFSPNLFGSDDGSTDE